MHKRACPPSGLLITGFALACAPTAAAGQSLAPTALSTVSVAKSDAILGTRSRLAEILAGQGVKPTLPVSIQPASRGTPLELREALNGPIGPAAAVLSGRPDIFGSVALKVERTPLDGRWRKVQRAKLSGAHAAYARSLQTLDALQRAEAVSRYVNGRIRFVDDSRQHGQADVWSTAAETLRRGRGDCEDYAIAKLQMLREAGVADRDLYLMVVKDLVRRSDHAVLVMHAGNRMLLLDNGTNAVVDADSVAGYRPMLTFAATGRWTHGYRHLTPTVEAASTGIPALDQRSRSASLLAFSTGLSR